MRILLIVNPYATSYDHNQRRIIEKALRHEHQVTVRETHRHGHGLPLTQGAVQYGYDAVIVWGGDGMVQEAANGLAGTDVPLGIIPGGSTSVTARTLGIPNEAVRASLLLLDWIEADRHRRIGLGKVGERYFTFTCGVGFDAAIVREVERRSMLKRTIGPSVYLAAAVAVFSQGFDRKKPKVRFRYDDGTESPPMFLALVSNSSPYTYLGSKPFVLAPRADHNRPLEVFGVTKMSLLKTLRLALAGFTSGRALQTSPIVHRKTTQRCELIADEPVDIQADGEYRGTTERTVFEWVPNCLSVYC